MKNKKIYIIGPVGSGKTVLARKLSQKLKISFYELDKVVWDDENGNVKRNQDEINKLFYEIISNDTWIIEDVGRVYFNDAVNTADIIYYIKLNRMMLYYRVIRRWCRQKLGLEKYNYKPTMKSLLQMFVWINKDVKTRKIKLRELNDNNNNVVILNYRKLEGLISDNMII